MSQTNSNKFYIVGKNKNEVLYSDIMMRKDPSPNNVNSSNFRNANFANTLKKGFFNNNMNKK
jgi:hypothetical protein